MLTVACVLQGSAYGVEYVERLHDMVRRNLPQGFGGRFVCLTDRSSELAHLAGVECRALTQDLYGWWAKMELFRPGQWEKGERIWYFDLDTVITGPLDKLFEYPGAFGLLEDVYRKSGFQSSVMSWIGGSELQHSIWEEWNRRNRPMPEGGDQSVLETFWRSWLPSRIAGKPWPPDFLQAMYPGSLRSYKVDCVWTIPKGTSVVFFHGLPKPEDVLTGWVPEVWKVGGGSAAELVMVGTIAQDRVLSHVADAMTQGYAQLAATEAHDKIALICGGSPSLGEQLPVIAMLQSQGALIFACNNVDAYLREHGIWPNFHVMIDAREQLAGWVNNGGVKLYASMCDPSTLRHGHFRGDLVIWHALTDHIDRVLGKAMLVGGGTTVGTRAMALAYVMGFRKLMCFGMDSCYAEGKHHAYDQALNDGERVLDCVVAGQKFKAAPWMVQQAEDWKHLTLELMKVGCEVTSFGTGMIGAIAKSMNSETVELDGFVWPSHDVETRAAVFGTLADLEKYIELCDHKRVAIQAGGNVGIWPIELAKRFEQVYTFEPDRLNWACLAQNIKNVSNITPYPAALGEVPGRAGIVRQAGNCGASALAMGGEIEVTTVDALELKHVDLLQLDVEGFELQALKGAAATIDRCSPLIVLELKGLGERYGYSDDTVGEFLKALDYQRIGVAHRDVIYKRVSHV